jgi:hypothetical protein
MSYVEIPLSHFVGEKMDILERLYDAPSIGKQSDERDDYQKIIDLEPSKNYNPVKVIQPSYFWDDELTPLFGSSQICIYDPYYLLYSELKEHIYKEIENHSIFRIKIDKNVEEEIMYFDFELMDKEDTKKFLIDIITSVPCSLYEIKNNLITV